MIELRCKLSYPAFTLDVDLELPGRGISALFGASGSGKTSCLRVIAGLSRAAGRLSVDGEVWQDDARGVYLPVHRRALGMVFQDSALFAHLNVRGNVEYGLRRIPAAKRRIGLDAAVELLGLEPLLGRRPPTLSGGERQRVAIARALAASPRLLLLDEPLASLDLARRAELLPYLQALQGGLDIPVVYVSHAPEEVARLARHLVLLERGSVRASGPAAELMSRLDLPLAHGDAAQVALEVDVLSHEAGLSRVAWGDDELWLSALPGEPGARRTLRVLARDVSLALTRHRDTSIVNVVPATVTEIADDEPGYAVVRLATSGGTLLARVTRRSVQALSLRPGLALQAQIKGGAIS